MSFVIDFKTIFNTDAGETTFPPITDVQQDDYFCIAIATQDDNEVELIDSTGWTKDTNGSPTQGVCEIEVWYKKVVTDDEVPTGIVNSGGDNTWATIIVLRGIDGTTPIDDSAGTASSSAIATYPAITSTQDNQIVFYFAVSDGQNMEDPDLQAIFNNVDAKFHFDIVNIETTSTIDIDLALSDQWCTSTVCFKRASGDTTIPVQIAPFKPLTQLTGQNHNVDAFRDAIRLSGDVLDADTRTTWTFDLATVNSTTDVVTLDSGVANIGRIVYITGASAVGITDGYYYFTTSDGNPGFRTDAVSYTDGTPVDITGTSTGTGTIVDVGVILRDYTDTSITTMPYPAGISQTNYFNKNIVGNARNYTISQDWTNKKIYGFYQALVATGRTRNYFFVMDSSNNWKIFKLSENLISDILVRQYMVDISSDTHSFSSGTLDVSDVKYYAILVQQRNSLDRFFQNTFQQYELSDVTIIGGTSTQPITEEDLKRNINTQTLLSPSSLLFEDYIKTTVPSQFVFLNNINFGDGINDTYINFVNKAISFPKLADNVDAFFIHLNEDKVSFEINNCSGSWNNEIITADNGYIYTSVASDAVDYTGDLFILASPTLQDNKIYNNVSYIECKQVIKNSAGLNGCTVSNSQNVSGGLLLDLNETGTLIDCSFKNNNYGIQVDNTGTLDLNGVIFSNNTKDINITSTVGTVTIDINAGETPTYTTEGATVIITGQVDIANANLIDGTRVQLHNVTEEIEMDNVVISGGTGYSYLVDFGDPNLANGDVIRMRSVYVSGDTAKDNIESFGVVTAAGLEFIDTQDDDTIYNGTAIAGSTITEFTADYPNVEINVSDPDNITTVQRLYAWYRYNESTVSGVSNYFNGLVAEDSINYKIVTEKVNIKLDNTSSDPLLIVGARIFRDDEATVIVSGAIQIDPAKAYLASSALIEGIVVDGLTTYKAATKKDTVIATLL